MNLTVESTEASRYKSRYLMRNSYSCNSLEKCLKNINSCIKYCYVYFSIYQLVKINHWTLIQHELTQWSFSQYSQNRVDSFSQYEKKKLMGYFFHIDRNCLFKSSMNRLKSSFAFVVKTFLSENNPLVAE